MSLFRSIGISLALVGAHAAASPPSDAEIMARAVEIQESPSEFADLSIASDAPRLTEEALEAFRAELESITGRDGEIRQIAHSLAREFAGDQMDAVAASGEHVDSPPAREQLRYRIFISQAMPARELRDLVETYRGRDDVALILRGMRNDQRLGDIHSWVYRLMQPVSEGMSVPNIQIDPEHYTALGVQEVPAVARYSDEGALEAYALGVTSVDWLESMVRSGRSGNLGVYGPVVPVAEVDLIEMLMTRAQDYDWDAAKERALGRYWTNLERHEIPTVTRHRVRELDPTFVVQQTVSAPDGTVLAFEGERINPLEHIDFGQTLVFVNPAEAAQLEWLADLIESHEGRRLTIMATQLNQVGDFEGYSELVNSVGRMIFKLPEDVRARFHIERVPAVVTQTGSVFRIEEQPPAMRSKEAGNVGFDATGR